MMDFKLAKKLLQIKKSGCSGNPFSAVYQEIMDKFSNLVQRMHDQSDTTFIKDNFPLAMLLMDCYVHIYKQRVELTKRDVDLLARKIVTQKSCTRAKHIPTLESENSGKAKEKIDQCQVVVTPQGRRPDVENVETPDSGVESVEMVGYEAGESPVESVRVGDITEEVPVVNLNTEHHAGELVVAEKVIDYITVSDDEGAEPVTATVVVPMREDDSISATPPLMEENDSHSPVPGLLTVPVEEAAHAAVETLIGPSTEGDNTSIVVTTSINGKRSEDKDEAIPRKRVKIDYGDPPVLISCYDEKRTAKRSQPPTLVPENYRRMKRLRVLQEEEEAVHISVHKSAEINCSTIVNHTGNVAAEDGLLHLVEPKVELDSKGSNNLVYPTTTHAVPESILAAGVVIKIEKEDTDYADTNSSTSIQPILKDYTREDEVQILNSITQIHYLLLSYGLSKEELERAFDGALKRLGGIYTQHNVCIQRQLSLGTSLEFSDQKVSTIDKMDIDMETIQKPAPEEAHELFAYRIQDRASIENYTGQTIMEMTTEKNKEESEIKMREMIKQGQKSIIQKYVNIPLIQENTKAFFTRVNSFERRMVKLLAPEKLEEEFDIREYAMKVLELTQLEIELQEQSEGRRDETLCPSLPSISSAINDPGTVVAVSEPRPTYTNFNFDELPSPTHSCDSGISNGVRWISLKKIFAHMQTHQPREAARMFYAVLVLLSDKNLDIKFVNYDVDSIALSPRTFELNFDDKYTRGFEIISNKGFDVDMDDVHVCLLSTKLRTEAFKEGLGLEHSVDLELRNALAIPTSCKYPASERIRNPVIPGISCEQLVCNELSVQISSKITCKSGGEKFMTNLLKTIIITKKRDSSDKSRQLASLTCHV